MFGWGKKNKSINKEEVVDTKQNIQEDNVLKDESKKGKLDNGFKAVYHVKLLYKSEPKLKVNEIVEELRKSCGDVEIICGNEKSDFFGVAFKNYCVKEDNDKYIPIEGVVGKIDFDIKKDDLEKVIENSPYLCNKNIIKEAKYQLLITDMMGAKLDYKLRLEVFNNLLSAVIKSTDCLAINWELSEQIIEPKTYLEKIKEDKLFGAMNIRTNIEKDYKIIDTLGLSAIGISDLQCKFKDIKDNEVEKVIKTNSFLLYEFGNVIKDGQIIQGIKVTDMWKCNHTISEVKPKRKIININIT